MKALVFHGVKDLRWEDVPDPKVREGEVLIKTRAVGICGSDIHGYLGLTGRRIPPMIMGHEFCGNVVLNKSDDLQFEVGDRVVIMPFAFCGKCSTCVEGKTNFCKNIKYYFGILNDNGGMAEYVSVPSYLLTKIPLNLKYEQAALTEPLAVAFSAAKKITNRGNDNIENILIFGAGTIGLLLLQCLKLELFNSKIIVSDLSDFRLNFAKKFKADQVVNPKKINLKQFIYDLTNKKGVDQVVDAVGIPETFDQGIDLVKNGGGILWIGNSCKKYEIDIQKVILRELTIKGTFIYTQNEFIECVKLMADGKVDLKSIIGIRAPLSQGSNIFKELSNGRDDVIKAVLFN